MSITRELEALLFLHKFRQCSCNENTNFIQISDHEYFVVRIFQDLVADLLYEEYEDNENPCTGKPYYEEMIKQGVTREDKFEDLMRNFKKSKNI